MDATKRCTSRVRRIEGHDVFVHYAQRSLRALLKTRSTHGNTWPWRDAVLGLSCILGAEDPRVAAYCTKAWHAGMAAQTPEEREMDCMEFCTRRVSELLALQGLEILSVPRIKVEWPSPFLLDAPTPTATSSGPTSGPACGPSDS